MKRWTEFWAGAAVAAGLALATPAQAQPVRTANVETELVSARSVVAPGETVTLVLRQDIRDGWHTYWVNPGDSGLATEMAWTLPPGVTAGPLLHPAPRVERLGPITTYVHEGDILYPLALAVPADFKGDALPVRVKVDWLVCDEICIPESAELSLDLPVKAQGADDPAGAALARQAIDALPEDASALGFEFSADGDVKVAFPKKGAPANPITAALAARTLKNPAYFPYNQSLIDHAGSQKSQLSSDQVTIAAPLSLSFQPGAAGGEGLLVAEIGGARRAFMFGRPPGAGPVPTLVSERWSGAAPPAPPPLASGGAPSAGMGLLAALGFAFLGGLILNVMPCVFPVLSIKALSLARGAHDGTAQRHGLLFLAGVMATFLLLAGALIALKAAGAAVGWGFQLQEPLVIATLALLFFVIGLNLVGAFEFGGGAQNLGGDLAGAGGDAGAFFTGALAVVAATPCTAPFMAGALGWAATQGAGASLAVFAGLGLGFAAPFTALAFAPDLLKRLPKPGPWMVRLKEALAFPMFGAAVWLVWVHAVQTGADGVVALLALFVALAFLVWALRQGRAWRVAGVLVAVVAASLFWRPLSTAAVAATAPAAAATAQAGEAEPWSPERLAELRAEGRPVFVNFTAAWCISCKANEAVALSQPGVKQAFLDGNVAYLKGDWTARDSVIAAELAAHGRSGVPLYLYYAPGAAAPEVLPQLLSERIVIDALAAGGAGPGE
jgi:DsbC/DsbD-like thiol-disulfide interchange protein/cytochrome c biogenesis protein CcdA